MSRLDALRQRARALLPGDCFLRRDQQLRALFVTDFPRRHADSKETALLQLAQGGFSVQEEKGLWLLDLTPVSQAAFIRSLPDPCIPLELPLPLSSLCRSLLHDGAASAEAQPWEPLKRSLLRLDAKEDHLLIPELRALCAQYKRQKAPLPTAVVSLLCEKEVSAC